MSGQRSSIAVGGLLLAIFVIGIIVAGGPKAATAVPFSAVSPLVCKSLGACFEADNSGHGVGVEGQALNSKGIGVEGIASSTASPGTGVSGEAFGPLSVAVSGQSFSTDGTHASNGVSGLSANGAGVKGQTTFNSTMALTGKAGVFGKDISTAFGFDMGVQGVSTRGVGVAGISKNGNAVTGSSTSANGVVGQTSFFATSGQGQAGMLGEDLATPNPFGTPTVNVGVEGTSIDGTGVLAESSNATGLEAVSNANTAIVAQTASGRGLLASATQDGIGLVAASAHGQAISAVGGVQLADNADGNGGIFQDTAGGESWSGAFGQYRVADFIIAGDTGLVVSSGPGLGAYVQNNAQPGPTAPPTLALESSGGPFIIAGNAMSLDGSGNMILAGTLTQNGTPLVAHRSSNGWGIGTYSAQQTTKTVEDLGEAELVGGQAYVRLDHAFASVTHTERTYLVFLTPQGDCHGLYVTQKSPAGFAVQEMNQGRSSIAFDYRIVAQSRDSSGTRLPIIAPIHNHRFQVPAPRVPHGLTAPRPLKNSVPGVRPGYVPSGH